jgi:hypothetical protein
LYELNFKPDTVKAWNLDGISWLDSIYAVSPTRELANSIGISSYPIPANNTMYFDFKRSLDAITHFELLDLSGRVCRQEDLLPGSTRFEMSVAGLEKGMYLARFNAKTGSSVVKVVVE